LKESTEKFLQKAFRSVQAAEHLTESADAEFGVGRAYYAMFYAAQALLNEKGLKFRKHAGVHSAFAEQFVKSGLLDKRYHRWLLAGFSKRITADYGIEAELTPEDATLLIGQAREFLAAAKTFLEKKA
jgi:uncharacterized protein (UPF0332 family)